MDDRIIETIPYGQHITLTCRKHPDLRWSTKNISHIGARSLFFDGDGRPEFGIIGRDEETGRLGKFYKGATEKVLECECSLVNLISLDPQPKS